MAIAAFKGGPDVHVCFPGTVIAGYPPIQQTAGAELRTRCWHGSRRSALSGRHLQAALLYRSRLVRGGVAGGGARLCGNCHQDRSWQAGPEQGGPGIASARLDPPAAARLSAAVARLLAPG